MSLCFTTIVKNERQTLPGLMSIVAPYVDEIVIVDTGSTDGTYEFLRSGGAKVLTASILDGFDQVRNFGLAECKSEFVVSFDADERPSKELMEWVVGFTKQKRHEGARVRRITTVDGGTIADEWLVRVFRRRSGVWQGKIHESVQVRGAVVNAPDDFVLRHDKTADQQQRDNDLYLTFYPQFNLGSGGRPMPKADGWVNFDIDPDHAPNSVQADVFEDIPHPLPARYILAAHVLEHASYHKAAKVLAMWINKLAPGGTIEIRVPDAGAVMRAYAAGTLHYLQVLQSMYGGQTTVYDYHNIAIDESWLTGQLTWNGLENVRRIPSNMPYELVMKAEKPS